jgi:hypothetical protein
MDLCDLGPQLVRQRWLRNHPLASQQEIAALLGAFYSLRSGAEYGDGVGQPGTWPRRR